MQRLGTPPRATTVLRRILLLVPRRCRTLTTLTEPLDTTQRDVLRFRLVTLLLFLIVRPTVRWDGKSRPRSVKIATPTSSRQSEIDEGHTVAQSNMKPLLLRRRKSDLAKAASRAHTDTTAEKTSPTNNNGTSSIHHPSIRTSSTALASTVIGKVAALVPHSTDTNTAMISWKFSPLSSTLCRQRTPTGQREGATISSWILSRSLRLALDAVAVTRAKQKKNIALVVEKNVIGSTAAAPATCNVSFKKKSEKVL